MIGQPRCPVIDNDSAMPNVLFLNSSQQLTWLNVVKTVKCDQLAKMSMNMQELFLDPFTVSEMIYIIGFI